ncbi:hypothetical protein SESBI_19058 [Sesbania bispinosa]|nr:hypothetical protein SESBI_19058 [Sesbania bispinosa]
MRRKRKEQPGRGSDSKEAKRVSGKSLQREKVENFKGEGDKQVLLEDKERKGNLTWCGGERSKME